MTNKQLFLTKIDELITLADKIIVGPRSGGDWGDYPTDQVANHEFIGSATAFLESIFNGNSSFLQTFQTTIKTGYISSYESAKGLLLGVRKHIDQDWFETTKNKVSAEIFSDYLEMAEYLNDQGFYIASAVIAGSTLEERLRQLSIKHNLPVETVDQNGKSKPVKAETMNTGLANFFNDGKNDQKSVTRNYGLRNDAAHGNWNSDTAQQKQHRTQTVEFMIKEIRLFINSNPI